MKTKINYWTILLVSLFQGIASGFLAFILTQFKLSEVVIIAMIIGFVQIQAASDTIKIQNDIFDLKESLKNKAPESKE